jgi:hypothetical protein
MELTASIDELSRTTFTLNEMLFSPLAKYEGKALRMELQRCYSIMTAVIPPSLRLQY